jgi:catechol 2,3-dioxygenase-like lactoylglutathione lyase family enzyme
MVMVSTDDLDASIAFYDALGFRLKFRDGDHYAALDGGSITLALATEVDHPMPGELVVGIKTDDVDAATRAVLGAGGSVVSQPRDDAHERRAVVRDGQGNGLVFYSPRQT